MNVYLADLGDRALFNAVYETILLPSLAVRTAVQAVLLPPFLVEVETSAAQSEG